MTDDLICFICLHQAICKNWRTLGQQLHVVYFAGVPGPTLDQLALRLSGCFVNKNFYGHAWVFKYCIYEEHVNVSRLKTNYSQLADVSKHVNGLNVSVTDLAADLAGAMCEARRQRCLCANISSVLRPLSVCHHFKVNQGCMECGNQDYSQFPFKFPALQCHKKCANIK